jgi:hypothetical protein
MSNEGVVPMHADGGNDEGISQPPYQVDLVAPEGLGFGTGTIGVQDRLSNPDDGLSSEILDKVDAVIRTGDILVDIDCDKDGKLLDDDGCGDGREVARVFEGLVARAKSLVRPKVFGGAPTMAEAAEIGLGRAEGTGLNGLFSRAVQTLKEKRIGFGGHSDTHAHGENCGCGAIDKSPAIVAKVIEERDNIKAVVGLLGLNDRLLDGDEGIINNYAKYYESDVRGHEDEYSGRTALQELLDNGKIVKELGGAHTEVRIIINMVKGKTVNQELVRDVSDGQAQVFCVDFPRLQEIAQALYSDHDDQEKALVSMVAHTLGVAGTLTKGDLPVYVISNADPVLAAA